MFEDVLKSWGGVEVSAMDVYSDIFRLGYDEIQNKNEVHVEGEYKANPIAYWRNNDDTSGHFRIMFDDTFEDTLKELQQADFSIINGLTYFGRRNLQNNASKMYAMIFDLDGVTDATLNAFLNGAFEVDAYPIPNYIVLSGNGVHLYYVFEYAIPLYPNIKLQLKELKYALTEKLWNEYTSKDKKKQMQGINQGFRVIGGKTKAGAAEKVVRAFQINTHPFNLDQLGNYIPKEHRVDEKKLFREGKLTLEQAKKKYPKWYEKVVVRKDKSRVKWDIKGKVHGENPYALYDWWIDKIRMGATFHHRYFNVMCLAIYGAKCDVPFEKVQKDAYGLVEFLNGINADEPFTKGDCDCALECYDDKYATFPIRDIEKLSGIQIERNKRNGRRQEEHLKRARAVQGVDYPDGSWINRNGRPVGIGTKENLVKEYILTNPEASVTEISKALKISRTTVYKYKPKQVANIDYIIVDSKLGEIAVESVGKSSEYDKMRLERLKAYQKMSLKVKNDTEDKQI